MIEHEAKMPKNAMKQKFSSAQCNVVIYFKAR